MNVYIKLSIILSLVVWASSGPIDKIPGCTYRGKTYPNLKTFPHINDCAIMQCQFGSPVVYYESCNKDIDGACHHINEQFLFKGTTYTCTKVDTSNGPEFKYEIAEKSPENCVYEGKTYNHRDKFIGSNKCQEYQCQNGVSFPLEPKCTSEIDGKCHLTGESYQAKGKTYTCSSKLVGGLNLYENIVLLNAPAGTKTCTAAGKTYNHLEVFRIPGSCQQRQCQDKIIKILTQACIVKQDGEQCYSVGEQWTSDGKTFQCNANPDGSVRLDTIHKGYQKCKRNEKWYGHLEVQTRSDGCTSVQCQDGKTPPVDEGCLFNVDNKCYKLNLVFEVKGTLMKCIKTGDNLYRIVQLDENNNVIEKAPPVEETVEYGEMCPNVTADIIFVWDSSGSISSSSYEKQKKFSCGIVKAFKIGPNDVRIGGVIFSKTAEKVFDLNTNDDVNSICDAINKTPFLGDETETQKAFNLILEQEMFDPKNGGRPKAMDIVIVITDGASSNTTTTVAAASRLKALGIQFMSIGIGNILMEELEKIASSKKNVFTTKNYDALLTLRRDIADRACNVPDEPPVIPEPVDVTKCPKSASDIVFVLDTSSSAESLATFVDIASTISSNVVLGSKVVQIGAVLINSQASNLFDLNKYTNVKDITQALAGITSQKGKRDTGSALELVQKDGIFTASHGGRGAAASSVAVVFFDGPSTDIDKSLLAAKQLRNQGVRIIVVAIEGYNLHEVIGLTGSRDFIFVAPNKELLNFVKGDLYSKICEATSSKRPDPEPPRCSDTFTPPCEHICENTDTDYVCSCRRGFLINQKDNKKCDDINECNSKVKQCNQVCVNTPGSFKCACNPGYTVSVENPNECTDIDECSLPLTCEHFCENTVGSFKCSCKPGYKVDPDDPTKCKDVDECATLAPCQQTCTNTDNGFSCSCKSGYIVNPTDPTKCDDVNECKTSPCQHTCTNKEGSFECSCKSGYKVNDNDPTKCDDVDECKTSSPCQQTCSNTEGSFHCSCESGFKINEKDPTKCDDIDECNTGSPCQQTCINNVGSYQCSCKYGYTVNANDPTKCDDADECGNSPCQQLCKNTDGGFECSCKPGYIVNDKDSTKCDDADECVNSPCQQLCKNIDGGFECSCKPGYKINDKDSTKCDDIDECAKDSPCQQKCTNHDGGYTCSCEDGYQVSPDNPAQCDDINECLKDSPCQQKCTNKKGGFSCSCDSGYVVNEADKTKCDDVDECLDVENPPCHHNCKNTPGSYECTCRDGYEPNECNPDTCKDIDECLFARCKTSCLNTRGGYKCT